MPEKEIKEKYINELTRTFEAFEYTCDVPSGVGCTWEMVASNDFREKSYALIFAPRIDAQRNNIRITQKKVDKGIRVVVVTEEDFEQNELAKSEEDGYALISLSDVSRFGDAIIKTRLKDRAAGKEISEEELDVLTSTREAIF